MKPHNTAGLAPLSISNQSRSPLWHASVQHLHWRILTLCSARGFPPFFPANAMEATQDFLIKKLETYDFSDIHKLFFDCLKPFTALFFSKPQNHKKPSKQRTEDLSSSIRALAKQYLHFLSRSISLLPKRLSESPKPSKTEQFNAQLFEAYKLCLDCLDAISSQLSGPSYAIHLQRAKFVHCLENWGRYHEAVSEGFRVLDSLRGIKLEGFKAADYKTKLVPCLAETCAVDGDFSYLVVDVVVTVVQCVSTSRTKVDGEYRRLLALLRESRPWFRVLDSTMQQKSQRVLLSCMSKVTMFLVKEGESLSWDLVSEFCAATLDEHANRLECSSSKDQVDKRSIEFLELVSYCGHKCRTASVELRNAVAEHLSKVAGNFSQDWSPFDLVLRLYAIGLNISDSDLRSSLFCSTTPSSLVNSPSIRWLLDYQGSLGGDQSCSGSDGQVYSTYSLENMKAYVVFYLNALKFLCRSLAEFVNSERKTVVTVDRSRMSEKTLCAIRNMCLHFCDVFYYCHNECNRMYVMERHGAEEIDKFVLSISIAALSLSLKSDYSVKRSMEFIQHLLSCDSLPLQGMKFLIACLHNSGIDWYRNKELKLASKALKLSCAASWRRVVVVCQVLAGKMEGFDGVLSENDILDAVSEACVVSSFLLDLICQESSHKLSKTIKYCLETWSSARNLFPDVPYPVSLIKHWVKIQCKLCKDADLALTLSSVTELKVGEVLEQELSGYQEMSVYFPEFCQRMQMRIIDILLEDVYVMEGFQRSNILVKKGRLIKAHSEEGSDKSIQYFSDAIDALERTVVKLNDSQRVRDPEAISVSHQLAVAYCLRALCNQEANPKSEQLFNDINDAVDIWMRNDITNCSPDVLGDIEWEHMLLLLYHILDILSMKGYMTFHSDIYGLIIKLFKRMNVPPEKCLLTLWESRRLSHALCISPINDTAINNFSDHYGEQFKSSDFWMSCMKSSPPLSVAFQQSFSFLSTIFPLDYHCEKPSLTSDEVKDAACSLIKNVSTSSCTAFVAGYLYYDLCERLVSGGRLLEALHCAKEAHGLRSKLLHEKFSYMIEQQKDDRHETGIISQKQPFIVTNLKVCNQATSKVWSHYVKSLDSDEFILTPWNVLSCYLESTIQVGSVHETIGNGAEAEALFHWGKSISCLQGLPLFDMAFSCGLGKIYCDKLQWDQAKDELQSAKQNLTESVACSKCLPILKSVISESFGNFHISCSKWTERTTYPASSLNYNTDSFSLNLLDVKKLYESSLQSLSFNELSVATAEGRKRSAKPRLCNTSKAVQNARTTRSRTQSSQRKHSSAAESVQLQSDTSKCLNGSRSGATRSVNQCKCQKSVSGEPGSLIYLVDLKLEYIRRRQILRLLLGLGNYQIACGKVDESHQVYLQCISVLARGISCHCHQPEFHTLEADLIGKEIHGDVFAFERAAVLYKICWFSLQRFLSDDTRIVCCNCCGTTKSNILSLLKLSFVLCREIPLLFQKVSRLLAIIFVICNLRGNFSIPYGKVWSANHWAAYFHQAAVGTHHNLRLLSTLPLPHKAGPVSVPKGPRASVPACEATEAWNKLRLVPESTHDIEASILDFYKSLPSATIVCMSFVGGSYASLLKEFIPYPLDIHVGMLLSHLNSTNQPIVILMPLHPVLQDPDINIDPLISEEENTRQWQSPWGFSVVDTLTPTFRSILRNNYLTSSILPQEDTERNRSVWWAQKKNLNEQLCSLLRDMEELWFGWWKFLLLGDLTDRGPIESATKRLVHDLKVKFNLNVNESLLKVVLGGLMFDSLQSISMDKVDSDEYPLLLFLEKACYIGGNRKKEDDSTESVSRLVFELIQDVAAELEDNCSSREPVVLVLDSEVQMLPWESMPILRHQEVYRMPSVASIFAALHKSTNGQEEVRRLAAAFPLLDPLDAYYLLNPSGDLRKTQAEFEEWFKNQNLEGKAGIAPTSEELAAALRSHDLFIYFGHGSGVQYIPTDVIQKIDDCATTVLMGCSSGSVILNGRYTPQCIAYSYISAGSPIVVANLWEVTDKDINRFGKALLEAWIEERCRSDRCVQCSILAEEFESMMVKDKTTKSKRGKGEKLCDELFHHDTDQNCCSHKLKVGHFVSQAREVCKLPYLIGAAPVCYGVPTGIRKKKDV